MGLTSVQLDRMGVGKRWWYVTRDGMDVEGSMYPIICKYIMHIEDMAERGLGLFLMGDNDVGKTSAAVIVLKAARFAGFSCFFIREADLIDAMRDRSTDESKHIIESATAAEFLVVDDVGKVYRTNSGFAERELDNFLRKRAGDMLPTILTANIGPDKIQAIYGDSMYRLLKETTIAHVCRGKQLRDKIAADNLAHFNSLGDAS